jgi:integrase/recombinase XerD
MGHYRDQLITRISAFARERGIADIRDFSRYDLRAFVGWLESFVSQHQRPLTPRGKQMALDAARRFFGWLHREGILSEDITQHVAKYRLDKDLEPRATPSAALEKMLASLDLTSPVGVRNMAMIQVMAFCGLRRWSVSTAMTSTSTPVGFGSGRRTPRGVAPALSTCR